MAESVRSLVLGLITSCAVVAAPINLIGNPSFEGDRVSPGVSQSNSYVNGTRWQIFTAIDRWGLGYPSYGVELQANNLYGVPSNAPGGGNAWDGTQWAELDYRLSVLSLGQTAQPQIYQDIISTVPGATYLLTFYYTPRPDGGTQQLGIFWGDSNAALPALVGSTTPTSGIGSLNWVPIQFSLTATSTSMRIGLGSLSNLITPNALGGVSFGGGNLVDLVTLVLAEGTTSTGPPGTTDPGTTAGGTTAGGTTAGGTTAGGTTAGGTTAGGTTAGGTTAGGTTAGGTTAGGTTAGGTTAGGTTAGGTTAGGTTAGGTTAGGTTAGGTTAGGTTAGGTTAGGTTAGGTTAGGTTAGGTTAGGTTAGGTTAGGTTAGGTTIGGGTADPGFSDAPEPGTYALMGAGLALLLALKNRQRS